MLLSHKTTVKLNTVEANIIGHMCYAASKLWNICNYERYNYKMIGLPSFPDWYYQKKEHKTSMWYKQLPSQTAQEVCKQLDKSWKSFFELQKKGKIENPRPPRYKKENIPITYMQNGIQHVQGSQSVRFSLPKKLMDYMKSYNINEKFLYLENQLFKNIEHIKQIKIYPPKNLESKMIIIYEVPDIEVCPDNGHYLSIDMGLHNLMTCYDSFTGESFIVGRKYLSICHYFDKEIARVQSQWEKTQALKGVKYPKPSKHVLRLYQKKYNSIYDYIHKVTRYITDYCKERDIKRVIIGDWTNIRKDNDKGHIVNQQLHGLPFKKIYEKLKYKLQLEGILLIKRSEAYSSQCSPLSPKVAKEYGIKENRVERGLYVDGNHHWNADTVGAYNILRLHLFSEKVTNIPTIIKDPYIVKVAV